jgi:N-acetyl sugar amidotransferase
MTVLDKNDPNYRQCSLSVMDNIADPDITFDENGICNYYYEYHEIAKEELKKNSLNSVVQEIKNSGKEKKYDCVIGVSGGVDSTYVSLLAKRYGLRALLVHFDNGWNSELAVKNVQSIVDHTGFDLYTYVIDWELFRDVQLSLLKASVVDVELCTDMFIGDAIVQQMKKFGITYSLSGNNVVTEAILPRSWYHSKGDFINLSNIHKKFGNLFSKALPIKEVKRIYWGFNRNFKTVKILNYLYYDKSTAKNDIINEFAWRDYGGKHWESVFTKFFQVYILPVKFKIDKRKAHLSTLVFSGQITKEIAIEELNKTSYNNSEELTREMGFILKKLGLSRGEFDKIMSKKPIQHSYYGTIGKRTDVFPILKYITFMKSLYKKLYWRK